MKPANNDAKIDVICICLLKNPRSCGVFVATEMFGEIVSDLAAPKVGSLGFGGSGSVGEKRAFFEPTLGSALTLNMGEVLAKKL